MECDPLDEMKEKTTPEKRSQDLVELLRRSDIFRDYSRAFRDTTGLPLGIRSLDSLRNLVSHYRFSHKTPPSGIKTKKPLTQ